jgi:chlorobactene glucosyltransferase
MTLPIALALLAVWVVPAAIVRWRLQSLVSLEEYPPDPSTPTPRVSVVLPARNEARHITDCVRSILSSSWPDLELIVVDDHSTDDTASLAHDAAPNDPRLQIISAPPLPTGWFGKQYACHTGAAHATGTLLLFTDADTRHAPDLIGRMAHAITARNAALLSVAGEQQMITIWEQAVQPVIFLMILGRYGGTQQMESARSPRDVVANGQCFLIARTTYDTIGGHATVRNTVAEDLMMAQTVYHHGRISLLAGRRQLSTRMYTSLDELMRGWGKNIFAGGRLAMPGGTLGQLLFPLLLLTFPLALLAPFVTLPLLLTPLTSLPLALWAIGASLAPLTLTAWLLARDEQPPARALLLPLGALITTAIVIRAIARGTRVEWKGREYTSH